MSTSRFAATATFLLFVFATWSPPAGLEAVGLAEPMRYALVLSASAAIILYAQFTGMLAIRVAPEWALLLAFTFYTALSAIWSDGGATAAAKGMLIVSTTMTCIAIANTVPFATILRSFYWSKCIFIVLSFIAVFVFPSTSIETGWLLEGEWKGVFSQKNGLGGTATFVVVAALALPLARHERLETRYLAVLMRATMFGIAAACLYMSGSRGAMALAVVGVLVLVLSRLPKTIQRLGLLCGLLGSVLLVNVVASTVELNQDDISVVGLTIDTNSRTMLWAYGLEGLREREFLGFGVEGFWTPERVAAFKAMNGWVLDNFHNGYVTILVEGGVVGIVLLLSAIGAILLLHVIAIANVRDRYVSLGFAWISMFLVGDLVENGIGRSTSSSFILFILLSLALRNHLSPREVGEPAVAAVRAPSPYPK